MINVFVIFNNEELMCAYFNETRQFVQRKKSCFSGRNEEKSVIGSVHPLSDSLSNRSSDTPRESHRFPLCFVIEQKILGLTNCLVPFGTRKLASSDTAVFVQPCLLCFHPFCLLFQPFFLFSLTQPEKEQFFDS